MAKKVFTLMISMLMLLSLLLPEFGKPLYRREDIIAFLLCRYTRTSQDSQSKDRYLRYYTVQHKSMKITVQIYYKFQA